MNYRIETTLSFTVKWRLLAVHDFISSIAWHIKARQELYHSQTASVVDTLKCGRHAPSHRASKAVLPEKRDHAIA